MPELLTADAPELRPATDPEIAWAAVDPITDPELADARRRMRELIDTRPQPLDRSERPGHFTGSALVVHADLEHILFNLGMLWVFGAVVKDVVGNWWTVGIFVFTAITAAGSHNVQVACAELAHFAIGEHDSIISRRSCRCFNGT